MSDYTEEQVDRVAEAIAKSADADYWTDEIAEWENQEDWEKEAHPDNHPSSAYEDREWFRKQARAALAAAGVAPQPEPEYEYRLVLELHPPKHAAWDQAETLWYPTVEEARATGKARGWIAHHRIDYPRARFTERVERRVIAGEAEPVPEQDGEQS